MKRIHDGCRLLRALAICAALGIGVVCSAVGAEGLHPWTHLNFQDDPETFRFAIVPDRSGGDLRGAFTNALAKLNLLCPDFVMSVGDLVNGLAPDEEWRRQQDELKGMISTVSAPFFVVVGNHDIGASRAADPDAYSRSLRIWQDHFGQETYYSFVHKNCLFLILNTSDGRRREFKQQVPITEEQYAWARKTLKEHEDVRWTFIFMHQPDAWMWTTWKNFEKNDLGTRKYTVFAGDWHSYLHVRRNNRDYYVLSVAGGVGCRANRRDKAGPDTVVNKATKSVFRGTEELAGEEYGEMDHITWVTMRKDGPVVVNLKLDGILPGDYLNRANTKSAALKNAPDLDSPSRLGAAHPGAGK